MNAGALFRTAHAFGASFVFTIAATYHRGRGRLADTSNAPEHLPFYDFPDLESFRLPDGCALVGIELDERAVDLPSFRHPTRAAYVLGPERGALSPALTGLCDHLVRIPTRFAINVGLAGALVMYDRMTTLGRFAPRPVTAGGPIEPPPPPAFGAPVMRRRKRETPRSA